MTRKPNTDLRRGWTTGACATAATKAALDALWGNGFKKDVTITLPRGEKPIFPLAHTDSGLGWAEVGITKDAGDDPDVTHGALIIVIKLYYINLLHRRQFLSIMPKNS